MSGVLHTTHTTASVCMHACVIITPRVRRIAGVDEGMVDG